MKTPRCINLDWLEVYAFEPIEAPRDSYYFESRGIPINVREYGTPIYNSMFTILDDHGNPMIEIRRDPKSKLMPLNACHIRLHNSYCYHDNAAILMQAFLDQYKFTFQRIARVDICMDFEKFDSGDDPLNFLYRYMERKYSKINQANLTSHGTDTWNQREWNSLSWGSPNSDVGTKFYNKTMELYDPILQAYRKPYIRWAWKLCGLVDDWEKVTKTLDDGSTYTPQIWRVEFSIRSTKKRWFEIELDGHKKTRKGKQAHLQSLPNTLERYSNREKLIVIFASLAQHYFHFKFYQEGQRKDRCDDKILFRWKKAECSYKLGSEDIIAPAKIDRPLQALLGKLRIYRDKHGAADIRQACDVLIRSIEGEQLTNEVNYPFRAQEITALRQVLAMKSRGCHTDAAVLLNELKHLLNVNDRTLPPIFMETEAGQ